MKAQTPGAKGSDPALPAYRNIFESLCLRSESSELNVSETSIMAEFQVSRDTARKALNLLEQEGFARRIRGRGTVLSGRNKELPTRIHVLVNENFFRTGSALPFRSKFFGIMDGILSAPGAAERSVQIMLVRPEDSLAQKISKITRQSGGVLILSHAGMEDVIGALAAEQFPHVIHAPSGMKLNSVATDSTSSVRKACSLLARTRKRIAFISPNRHSLWFSPMFAAYQAVLNENSLEPDPSLVHDTGEHPEMPESFHRFLAEKNFDALFVAQSETARSTLSELSRLGISLPRDASFVAYEDHPDFQTLRPSISAIRVPLAALGNVLVTELTNMVRFGYRNDLRITIPEELIIRDSL